MTTVMSASLVSCSCAGRFVGRLRPLGGACALWGRLRPYWSHQSWAPGPAIHMIAVRSPNQHLPRSARTRSHGAATSSCTRRPHHSAPPPRVFHSHLALGTTLIMATAGGVVEAESWWLASDVEQWKACRRLSVLDQYEPPEHRTLIGNPFAAANRLRSSTPSCGARKRNVRSACGSSVVCRW